MRLDIFLKLSRLEPRRTLAQELCEGGAVKLNGARAKSSREVKAGDLIALRRRQRVTTVRVLQVPSRAPSRKDAASLYEIISTELGEEHEHPVTD